MTAPSPTAAAVRTVEVSLGSRSYHILIGDGLIADAGAQLARRFAGSRVAVVTDATVADLHLARLTAALDAAGIEAVTVVVPAGEASKSFACLESVAEQIIAARLERTDLVVALGGGVIGDLAGFAAGIVRRGMGYIQVPTSLLAQVDSSVGGKTGINSRSGKNLVGLFHQPSLVLADTAVLSSLPLRQFRAGYAEVAKYALLGDPEMFDWLCAHWREIFEGGPARSEAVARCCRHKAGVVARDERETGERALLNLGHTFGHALEAATGYSDRLLHGEGVAIGMAMAFRLSHRLGLCGGNAAEAAISHLRDTGLPVTLDFIGKHRLGADDLLTHIRQDKKVSRGRLTFILTRGIGAAFVAADVDADTVLKFLQSELTP